MRNKLAITLSVASLLAAPTFIVSAMVATPAMAQPAPTVENVRAALLRAIRSAQASNLAAGITGAAAEANIQSAIQAAIIAANAPAGIVQSALSSMGSVGREAGVAGAIAAVQLTVNAVVAQNNATSGVASTSGGSTIITASSFSGSSGGGGGSDYRPPSGS